MTGKWSFLSAGVMCSLGQEPLPLSSSEFSEIREAVIELMVFSWCWQLICPLSCFDQCLESFLDLPKTKQKITHCSNYWIVAQYTWHFQSSFYSCSLLKKILKSRLFVGSRLSDSWMQENAMGPFERRRSNISRRLLSEAMTAWFWQGCSCVLCGLAFAGLEIKDEV